MHSVRNNILHAAQQRLYPSQSPLYASLLRSASPHIFSRLDSSCAAVLDAACGRGICLESLVDFASPNLPRLRTLHGVDLDPGHAQAAQKSEVLAKFAAASLEKTTQISQSDVGHNHGLRHLEPESLDSVYSAFGIHEFEQYDLKCFLRNARKTLKSENGKLVFAAWTPGVREDCLLTGFLHKILPVLNTNVRHQKPFRRNFYPHNLKSDNKDDQQGLFNELLAGAGYDEDVEISEPVKVEHAFASFEELQKELREEKTFGDLSALIRAQSDETENEVWKILRTEFEKGLKMRKNFVVVSAKKGNASL